VSEPAASSVFSLHAPDYDASRRRLVPEFDAFYGAVLDVLALQGRPLERVLDLGAGTGLLSGAVQAAHPDAGIELLDGSAEMLQEARSRLGGAVGLQVGDLRDELPDGPYDAIVSALAIHHLSHAEKRGLFRRAHERLRDGGVFVNAEQVAAPSRRLEDAYESMWEAGCRARGASEAELEGARQRMLHDVCAASGSQLRWLAEAGFQTVDCVWRSWRFAVLAAWKATA
jgi:tRNA (cmo5U34)-methyltransferase